MAFQRGEIGVIFTLELTCPVLDLVNHFTVQNFVFNFANNNSDCMQYSLYGKQESYSRLFMICGLFHSCTIFFLFAISGLDFHGVIPEN